MIQIKNMPDGVVATRKREIHDIERTVANYPRTEIKILKERRDKKE
jgi:hypothetical protein